MAGETLAFTYLAAGRWLSYLCTLALIGAVSYRFVVLPAGRPQHEGDTGWVVANQRRAATIGMAAAGLLSAVHLWRLYAQTYSIFGLDETVTWSVIRIVARETQWGVGWTIQLGAAVFAVVACATAWARPRPGWALGALAGFGVAAALPLTGHAVSQASPVWAGVALQVGHVLGAGVWLGTLFVLLVADLSRRDAGAGQRIPAMVNAFSPVALLGAGILAATGVLTAILYLDAVGDLWRTAYGLALLLKILLVAGVAGVGAYNWRNVKPALGEGSDRLRGSAGLELALAGVVLAVTAVLVALALE